MVGNRPMKRTQANALVEGCNDTLRGVRKALPVAGLSSVEFRPVNGVTPLQGTE